jgi:hypothetical protein
MPKGLDVLLAAAGMCWAGMQQHVLQACHPVHHLLLCCMAGWVVAALLQCCWFHAYRIAAAAAAVKHVAVPWHPLSCCHSSLGQRYAPATLQAPWVCYQWTQPILVLLLIALSIWGLMLASFSSSGWQLLLYGQGCAASAAP